jgi:hypothetical protein
MGLDLLAQIGVVTRPAKQIQQPLKERVHGSSQIGPSTR